MIKTRTHLGTLALGLGVVALWTATLQAQVTLNPAWRVTPDTTKPGFKWNYFQNTAVEENSTARTELALSGLLTDSTGAPLPNLGDPNVIGAAIAAAAPANPANGLLYFEITNVINLSRVDGDAKGNFTQDLTGTPDQLEPGLNVADTDSNGQAAEILTYLTLPAGTNTMGVNSDDGFQTSTGANPSDAFGRVVLGECSCGRGATDTLFTFVVQQAGTYAFRTIWENGGGDSNIEWFTVDTNGTKVLVNDVANGGVPAYRAASGVVPPFVKSVTPQAVPRQTESTSRNVTVVLADGSTAVDTNSITLTIDGTPATITKQRLGTEVTVDTGVLPGFHAAGESHTAVLTYKDVPGTSHTQQWTFYNLENLILPANPVTGENFDSYPEASSAATTVPPGWVATNATYVETPGWDLTDIKSDAFLDWVLISTNTVFPLEDEVLINNTAQTVNGQPVTNWMSGNLIFVASDGRASRTPEGALAPQAQFVVSAPFNLSTVTNPVLTFSSGARLSIGNPDQMTMEYSVDGGLSWLPVIYMRSSSTITLLPDGSYDALAMFNTVNTNVVPLFPDPLVGPRGGKWGDMLAAPISQALAPYIANRNDGIAARRVEAIRLPQASKKSDVRLRLTHLSHCGWEWGVDNIAFYDIAPLVTTNPNWPSELGQTVNGFQDDFTGATRDPNWRPFGPGGDLYVQANGLMHVQVRSGDPNHLLYVAPGYNTTNQEVVARIRITAFGTGDPSRGGIGVGVQTNAADLSRGINLHFRDFAEGGVTGRHFMLLDDARSWGPAGLPTTWANNTWFWLRLRQEPNATGGTNDVFAKAWPADGVTPEPTNWQMSWNYIPTRTPRSGFAGITGSSIDGVGNFEVDYILIKADGLPGITVNFDKTAPPVTVPQLFLSRLTATTLRVSWFGAGVLESATDVAGTWTPLPTAASPTTATGTLNGNKFYRVKQ